MPNFNYTAISDTTKKTTKGTIGAGSEAEVIELLKKQKLRPVSVSAQKSALGSSSLFKSKKVKSDDLVVFTRQLAAMIGAGVPLLRSLNSLQQHAESAALKDQLVKVIEDVQSGTSFGDALAKHPSTFNDVYVNMVRAGETAGILDEILNRLAVQQEKSSAMKKRIKSAMTYPVVLLVITVIAFFGLMLFVIPQIGDILKDLGGEDTELPIITQIMLAISSGMISWWFIVLPAFAGLVFGVLRYIKTPSGRFAFHKLILKVPAINPIIRKVVVARFARTFSALTGAGVSIIESMTVTAHALGNVVYEQAMLDAIDRVKNGEQLSSILDENELYPAIVSQMLAVGEETGQTETVLVKVADFYEDEVDASINSVSSIIEPVMIVLMGGMVGLIAASVMGPIASLASSIQK